MIKAREGIVELSGDLEDKRGGVERRQVTRLGTWLGGGGGLGLFCLLWAISSPGCSNGTGGGAKRVRKAQGVPTYRTCSAAAGDKNVRQKMEVTKFPPLTDDEKAYLQGLSRYISKAGLEKGMASAEERIRKTDSVALKWFMVEQYVRMQKWVKAVHWANHFLCHYPNVEAAWEAKLQILVTLLGKPLVPGISTVKIKGGIAVGPGGPRDKNEVEAVKKDALLTADYASRRWPKNGVMTLKAARVAKKLKKTKLWVAYAKRASKNLPEEVEVSLELLEALRAANKWDELIKRAKAATKRWPTNPEIYAALAAGAKAAGDIAAQKQAHAKAAYFSFFLPEVRVAKTPENEKLVTAVQSKDKTTWKSALKTLRLGSTAGGKTKRNAAVLGGAVSRCHCCKEKSKEAARCRAYIRGLTKLGKEGAKVLHLLAHRKHTCWPTKRMVFQGLARMWKHFSPDTLYELMAMDQHGIQFYDFIGSLAEAYYPGTGNATRQLVSYPKMSEPARLTAIRALALYFGAGAVPALKKLYANPKAQRGPTETFGAPPSKETLRFAALLCLHAVTGTESYLQDAEKEVKAWGDKQVKGLIRGELLCLPQAKESKAYKLISKWSTSGDPKLGPVGKTLLKAHSTWNRSYLYRRRFVDKVGLLKHIEERCDATAGAPSTAPQPNGPMRFQAATACRVAGQGYALSESLDANEARASELYKKGCEMKDGESCTFAGIAAGTGAGLAKSEEVAAKFYIKGCDLKDWTSCANLGWQLLKGHGVPKSVAKAKNLFIQSCRKGEALGCHHLGSIYLMAMGVKKDIKKAHEFFTQSCDMNYAVDCFNLATIHAKGMGPLPKDDAKAQKYFKKACKLGFKRACEN